MNKFLNSPKTAICLLAAIWIACPIARGQTNLQAGNPRISITTNLVVADPAFRVVNGQLYNTAKSQLWTTTRGEVESKKGGLVFLRTYTERKHSYAAGGAASTSWERAGGYMGGPAITGERTYTWKEYGPTIAVTNLDGYASIADGQNLGCSLMRVGTLEHDGRTLELWDRGTVNTAQVITTNRPGSIRPPRVNPIPAPVALPPSSRAQTLDSMESGFRRP